MAQKSVKIHLANSFYVAWINNNKFPLGSEFFIKGQSSVCSPDKLNEEFVGPLKKPHVLLGQKKVSIDKKNSTFQDVLSQLFLLALPGALLITMRH